MATRGKSFLIDWQSLAVGLFLFAETTKPATNGIFAKHRGLFLAIIGIEAAVPFLPSFLIMPSKSRD
jgi:hypothetical protein